MPNNKEIKNKICSSKSAEEIFQIIDEYEKDVTEQEKGYVAY